MKIDSADCDHFWHTAAPPRLGKEICARCGAERPIPARRIEDPTAATPRLTVDIDDLTDLPGYELGSRGLADLAAGRESVEAALVSIGATRLSRLGLAVPQPLNEPEERLYQLLEAAYPPDAVHARYNALVRRLVSFERTLAGIESGRLPRGANGPPP